jgi:hypothetical protein
MSRAAFSLASSTTQAQSIVQRLGEDGFHDRDISVHSEDGKELDRAKKTFEAMGAEDIGVSSEHAVKSS